MDAEADAFLAQKAKKRSSSGRKSASGAGLDAEAERGKEEIPGTSPGMTDGRQFISGAGVHEGASCLSDGFLLFLYYE